MADYSVDDAVRKQKLAKSMSRKAASRRHKKKPRKMAISAPKKKKYDPVGDFSRAHEKGTQSHQRMESPRIKKSIAALGDKDYIGKSAAANKRISKRQSDRTMKIARSKRLASY